jgi:hypothetical protein
MTTKQYWHKTWQREGVGLLHSSGLQAQINTEGTWVARRSSLPAWQAFEQASGVPAHLLPDRLARLLKEAAQWRDPDQRRADHLAKRLPPGTKPQTQKSPAPT